MPASFSARSRVRTWSLVATGAFCALLLLFGAFTLAVRHVPAFYLKALEIEDAVLRSVNDQMLENATALVNAARHPGQWYALLTEEQINGWLAIDLARNHPELLPPGATDLRARFEQDRAIIACSYQYPGLSTIVSVKFDLYLAEPHVVALRVHGARAGAIPVPITPIMDGIAQAAERLNPAHRMAAAA